MTKSRNQRAAALFTFVNVRQYINSGDINTEETARECINKQLTLLNVEEQNRLIGYIDGILDSKKGK